MKDNMLSASISSLLIGGSIPVEPPVEYSDEPLPIVHEPNLQQLTHAAYVKLALRKQGRLQGKHCQARLSRAKSKSRK